MESWADAAGYQKVLDKTRPFWNWPSWEEVVERPERAQQPGAASTDASDASGRGGARAALRAAPPEGEAAPTHCYPKAAAKAPTQGVPEAQARANTENVLAAALAYDAWTEEQRRGLDTLCGAMQQLRIREQERLEEATGSAAGSQRGGSRAGTGARSATSAASVRSRTSRMSHRRSNKEGAVAVYGQLSRYDDPGVEADDLALGADAEEMQDEECRRKGCVWVGDSLDGYWVTPHRLAWCRDCGRMDD